MLLLIVILRTLSRERPPSLARLVLAGLVLAGLVLAGLVLAGLVAKFQVMIRIRLWNACPKLFNLSYPEMLHMPF